MKKENNKNHKLGFTLIELLVVVLIIGILAAIAVPQYYYIVNVTKVKTNMPIVKAIADGMERYALANGEYPTFSGGYANSNTQINKVLDIDVPNLNYIVNSYQSVIWDSKTGMRIGYSLQQMPKVPAKKFFCYYHTITQGLPILTKEKICKKTCNANEIKDDFPTGGHKGCIVN